MAASHKTRFIAEKKLSVLISAYSDLRALYAQLRDSRVIAPEMLEKLGAIKQAVGSAVEFLSELETEMPQDSPRISGSENEQQPRAKG